MDLIKRVLFSKRMILGGGLFLLFVFCLYPFLTLFFKIVFPQGGFTLQHFEKVLNSKSTMVAFKNTLWVSVGTCLMSTFMALPLSWLLTRTNIPMRDKWRSWFCLPYAIPPYIGAIAWIYLTNPSNGILNSVFGEGFFNIYTNSGLIWVMGSFFYTFILLSLLAALDRMDPSLEEAARLSGASPIRVFFQITVPIIFPSLMSGILLVLLASAASFGVPAMIGNPAGIYLLTTKIYTLQKMGSMNGIFMAGALSILLLVLATLVLIINQRILSKNSFKTVSGKTSRPSLIDLGSLKTPLSIGLAILFVILFVMPLGGITITALSKIQGKFELSNFGFQNFTRVFFETDETPRALMNSFNLAFIAATATTLMGLILGYINKKTKLKGRSAIEILASLPYSTPGTVLALAFILTFSAGVMGIPIRLYNTLGLIVIAYFAKYLNFSLRTTSDGFGQIDDCLAEASRVSGATWWISMKTIWFPLMKPALMASWFLVFMPAFSELTMTILLTGPGLETLGTLIFQLQEYGDASGGGAAVLALLTVIAVGLINGFVKFISKGKYGL
ncbi:MAG: iron ABC transporter permease [Bacteriovoracaceae bacterium]|nr:iron ABC transporter permease [Bacteriovoracaceae bacterium]